MVTIEEAALVDMVPFLTDEGVMEFIEANDPDAERDDMCEPEGVVAEFWREADRRGLLS